MKTYFFIVLLIVSVIIIYLTEEPKNFKTLKRKYVKFLEVLPPKFKMLNNRAIMTGTTGKNDLGSNVNKGYEIYICIDNDINSMFHVLLHELAHCTVTEYQHSENFWNNFKQLKEIAQANGFYEAIVGDKEYCGKKIRD